jgi:hypothetical protein
MANKNWQWSRVGGLAIWQVGQLNYPPSLNPKAIKIELLLITMKNPPSPPTVAIWRQSRIATN